nr:MAG TPA: hypothetical protein [Caudoviricetes sp.]
MPCNSGQRGLRTACGRVWTDAGRVGGRNRWRVGPYQPPPQSRRHTSKI